ncbi:COP9 signalosome subunit 1, variant [Blastomyces dermatitidis ATCC 18188]|uniref:COP9 signalosome complex subunit 1 n=1 Tax=Ajellomyces dermatitidis (strain ATCC 18188 / CBS 674.68) TaxID=653446 RepID=F2TJQ8_AJEDA|nr:COP9 signalosome subunit 1 [Blastomyces dermatitidis ATCC 18188]KMW68118.1 COP9 signalosome subunit 1, variant [Blastomyces dermatitidis ATCC 18188]
MDSLASPAPFAAGADVEMNMGLGEGNASGNRKGIPGETGGKAKGVRVDEPPKFDLESYISNYSGRTKFARLYLIGACSTFLSVEALKMAVADAKGGKDVNSYTDAVEALARVAPQDPEAKLDAAWVDHTSKVVKAETDRLEHELKGYKNNLIKESIRMGNEDLGHHYHRIGDLPNASKAYSRMREYCTTTSHIASMLFKNINVAIDRGDWLGVQSSVQRLRNLQFKPEDEAKSKAKMFAALGLSQLASSAYHSAAINFLSTDPVIADNYKEVISANDIAVYGGLCALASMDRADLQTHVLENKSFRNFLELEPHIRRAISFFCASKFRLCLDILEAYRADYLLDIHLQKHVPVLYSCIRTKAMQQYIIPYSRVTLDAMVTVFSPGQAASIKPNGGTIDLKSPFIVELIDMIQKGTLDARVDVEKGVLVTTQTNTRENVQAAVIQNVKEYVNTAHIQLLRMNILHAGLEVPAVGIEGDGGRGGGGMRTRAAVAEAAMRKGLSLGKASKGRKGKG